MGEEGDPKVISDGELAGENIPAPIPMNEPPSLESIAR